MRLEKSKKNGVVTQGVKSQRIVGSNVIRLGEDGSGMTDEEYEVGNEGICGVQDREVERSESWSRRGSRKFWVTEKEIGWMSW